MDNIDIILEGIKESSTRLVELAKGLKDYSSSDRQNPVRVNIHNCLDSTLLLLKHKLSDNIKIVKEYNKIKDIFCYPGKINQVFMNILNNAVQAINGEGTITIITAETEQYLTISIADTGCGMSEESKERIFDPFYTTKKYGEGTGLGMSISYGIIKEHNGMIEVKSRLGEGSEFIISLPLLIEKEKAVNLSDS